MGGGAGRLFRSFGSQEKGKREIWRTTIQRVSSRTLDSASPPAREIPYTVVSGMAMAASNASRVIGRIRGIRCCCWSRIYRGPRDVTVPTGLLPPWARVNVPTGRYQLPPRQPATSSSTSQQQPFHSLLWIGISAGLPRALGLERAITESCINGRRKGT